MQVATTPSANKFPKTSSSNSFEDSDASGVRHFEMEANSGMENDSSKIRQMSELMAMREEERLARQHAQEYFPHVVTVRKLDVAWVIQWLTKNTIFTTEELSMCMRVDPESPIKMFIFETQWPPLLTLNSECLHKETFGRMSLKRSESNGKRLNMLKVRGGCRNGVIDWSSFGCYKFVLDEGRVLLRHSTGWMSLIPAHMTIMDDFALQMNWYDFGAEVFKYPAGAQYLWTLMEYDWKEDKEGPWRVERYCGGNSKRFNAAFKVEYKDLMDTRAALNQSQGADAVSTGMQQVTPEKRADGLTMAREEGSEVLEAKKKRRRITENCSAEGAPPEEAAAAKVMAADSRAAVPVGLVFGGPLAPSCHPVPERLPRAIVDERMEWLFGEDWREQLQEEAEREKAEKEEKAAKER